MAAPSISTVGTLATGTGALSPAWPVGHAAGQLGVLVVWTFGAGGSPGTPSLTVPSGFVAGTLPSAASSAFANNAGIWLYWCRATSGSMTAPTVQASAAGRSAVIFTIDGHDLGASNPIDGTIANTAGGNNTAPSLSALTTTSPNALVVMLAASVSTSSSYSAEAAANITPFTEFVDVAGNARLGGAAGALGAAGSSGAFTATLSLSTQWVTVGFSVFSPISGSSQLPTARADGRVWLKPGFGRLVAGSTQQNNGVPGSVPAPGFIAGNPKPWLRPGFGALIKGSTQTKGAGVDAPPTGRPIPANPRPWLAPGFGRRIVSSYTPASSLALQPSPVFWGPHFPPRGSHSFWDGHFPEGIDTTVPPSSTGAAAFALVLESGVKVTYAWQTGLFKSYSGLERRSNLVDDPAQRFEGQALLIGAETRAARARLARFAALGSSFLLGLPYEELALTADAAGGVLSVNTTTLSDWAIPGQRVLLRHLKYGYAEATIQSVTATTITVSPAPGNPGLLGGTVMPEVPVFLDAQQSFARYQTPDGVERWQIKARNVQPGYMQSATFARLDLGALGGSGAYSGAVVQAKLAGTAGNSIQVQAIAGFPGCIVVEDLTLRRLSIAFQAGGTTMATLAATFNASSTLAQILPGYDPTKVLQAGDVITLTSLSGGVAAAIAPVGIGASVTMFAGRPVWDRRLDNPDTANDSMQSMAQPADLGGLPFNAGSASVPDWGRSVQLTQRIGAQWQWLKKFLDTVRASWKSFWLPTWRPDLVWVSSSAGAITVQSGENAGDFFAWWPQQRQHLQLWQADGTITYARVSAALDNGNGTVTLTVVDGASSPVTLSGSAVQMVSWLEQSRFEDESVPIGFADFRFQLATDARVVQQKAEKASVVTFDDYESSVEMSQPRIGIQFDLPIITYRFTTNTRDVVIDGATYHAEASGHDAISVKPIVDEIDGVTVTLPVKHPAAQRWILGLVRPQRITVTIKRSQPAGAETTFSGEVVSASQDGHLMHFKVLSIFALALERTIPSHSVGRECPHVLGDANCTVDIEALKVTTTVNSFSGVFISVASIGGHPNTWAEGGKIYHPASNTTLTIAKQVGTTVTIQAQIPELQINDQIVIYPGCAKDVATCAGKFDNAVNFGNEPQLPLTNPTRSPGYGVISS